MSSNPYRRVDRLQFIINGLLMRADQPGFHHWFSRACRLQKELSRELQRIYRVERVGGLL